jgi:hypothetical protein
MSVSSTTPPAAIGAGTPAPPVLGGRVPSPRLQLARLARSAALGVGGVLALDAGPDGRFAVVSGDERIDGVVCVAVAGGGVGGAHAVALRLVCALVPLGPLGERVRVKVREAAAAAGLSLGSVSVHIAAVAAPGEMPWSC